MGYLAEDKNANNGGSAAIITEAIAVLKTEAEGITHLINRIDHRFVAIVELIAAAKGRIVVGGIGKSGIIGRKIVATLNSTGTRSIFMHPVEAVHGDLGMLSADDIFLALSNSGETEELNHLLAIVRGMGCKIIAFTGNPHSTLARGSDMVIDVSVEREACPLGLAPTASTTAQLAMGDALAVTLLNRRNFKSSDFKRIHPGGALGQRLAQRVGDIMLSGAALPIVKLSTPLQIAVEEIDRIGLGVTFITNPDDTLAGIITDGDIRRCIARRVPLERMTVQEIMTTRPQTLSPDVPAYDALNLMEKHEITVLPITDRNGVIRGLLHLHDILGKGEFKFNGT